MSVWPPKGETCTVRVHVLECTVLSDLLPRAFQHSSGPIDVRNLVTTRTGCGWLTLRAGCFALAMFLCVCYVYTIIGATNKSIGEMIAYRRVVYISCANVFWG